MRKIILIWLPFIILVIGLIAFVRLHTYNFVNEDDRDAVKIRDTIYIGNPDTEWRIKEYILCSRARVTGFDWEVVGSSTGEEPKELCNIIGADPYSEICQTYEFELAFNTFVFYVEEKKTYFSEQLGDCTDYIVSGWDILYPVKHGELGHFNLMPSKHIVESDSYRN